jgi:hypothetical protein
MVAGWYTIDLDRSAGAPRIAGIRLESSYETGSRELVEKAQERAGSTAGTEDQRREAR